MQCMMAVACCATMLLSAGAAPAALATAWDTIRASPDLSIFTALLGRYPHLQLALSNPAFKGTVFPFTDAGYLRARGLGSVRQAMQYISIRNDIEPLMYERDGSSRRFYWQMMQCHIVPNTTIPNTAAAWKQQAAKQEGIATLSVDNKMYIHKAGPSVLINIGQPPDDYADIKPAPGTVLRSVKVNTKVWVHVMNWPIDPGMAPPDHFSGLDDLAGTGAGHWAPLVNASSYRSMLFPDSWPAFLMPKLTLFMPSAEALSAHITGTLKTTDAALLANTTALDALVGAHIVPGHRLWAWDLMDIAMAFNNTGKPFLSQWSSPIPWLQTAAGASLSVTTDLTRPFLVLPSGRRVQVNNFIDTGGNDLGCYGCDDYSGVLHVVDRVLL